MQFFYVNQSFAPSLDQSVQNLFDCFGSDGKLILAYCRTQAWGWGHDHESNRGFSTDNVIFLVFNDLFFIHLKIHEHNK